MINFIKLEKFALVILLTFCTLGAFAQNNESDVDYRFRISTPGIILPQLGTKAWSDRKHTQHIELHGKINLDNKNIVGIKFATWQLFQPMGIVWWDGLLDKVESGTEFYPGHVRETGVGFSYQRMLWKGLFSTVEVLPQFKTYLDEDRNKIGNGFKLYNSLHLGYHIPLGKKKRFFIEPQIHAQTWLFDTDAPAGFKELDDKWRNYFLFEPNLYIGVNF